MSQNSNCLNCNENIIGKFCYQCGQKSDTHRITFKHFLFHDILHGIWHFEKGILFTIKEAFIRPGQAALDYISGKRIKYYNVFYLILLLIGLNIILTDLYDQLSHTYFGTDLEFKVTGKGEAVANFVAKYTKLLIFALVPIFAINSFCVFKRLKLNFSEHLIIAGIIVLGIMIITTIGTIAYFLEFIFKNYIFDNINILVPIAIIFYILFTYYQATKKVYSKLAFCLKILQFCLLVFTEIYITIKSIKYYFF